MNPFSQGSTGEPEDARVDVRVLARRHVAVEVAAADGPWHELRAGRHWMAARAFRGTKNWKLFFRGVTVTAGVTG